MGDIKLGNDTLKILSLIPILVITLSLLGLANNQIISFYQKKKLISVLYSTSMSKSQLKRMLFFEVFLTFLSGIILGTILSIKIIGTMSNIIYVVIGYFELGISSSQVLIVLILILILLLLTSIFPIVKLNKINIVKEIQYE